MPVISGQITLAAAARQVSDVYGTPPSPLVPPSPGNQRGLAMVDVPLRQVFLRSEAAAIYIGATNAVTSTAYGETAASGGVIILGPFDNGGIKLSDIWAAGNGATLHVFGIVY